MSKPCEACMKDSLAPTQSIYLRSGQTQPISLCRTHDIEFYKLGQEKFILKYRIKVVKEDLLEDIPGDD